MVDVGSVEIKGTINTSDIERGFVRMELGLASVKGKAAGFTTDLERMSAVSFGLVNNLIRLGVEGAQALIGASKHAPALADEYARIGVAMMQIGRTIGEDLEPAFNAAATFLENFASRIEEKGTFGLLLEPFSAESAEEWRDKTMETISEAWEPEPFTVGGGGGPTGGGGARTGDEAEAGTLWDVLVSVIKGWFDEWKNNESKKNLSNG